MTMVNYRFPTLYTSDALHVYFLCSSLNGADVCQNDAFGRLTTGDVIYVYL